MVAWLASRPGETSFASPVTSSAAAMAAARREAKEVNGEGEAAKEDAIGLNAAGSRWFESAAKGLVLIARVCGVAGDGSSVMPDGAAVCAMCCGCSLGALARGEIGLCDEEGSRGDVALRWESDAARARWRWLKVAKRRRVAAARRSSISWRRVRA